MSDRRESKAAAAAAGEEGVCIEEDEDGSQQQQQHHPKKNKEGNSRKIRRAKNLLLLLLPFRKIGKPFTRKKRRSPSPPPPFPYAEDTGKGCFLCFMQHPRVPPDSSLRPAPDAPKTAKPSSYYDFLKSLIEKNDFYSPECNVHRDI